MADLKKTPSAARRAAAKAIDPKLAPVKVAAKAASGVRTAAKAVAKAAAKPVSTGGSRGKAPAATASLRASGAPASSATALRTMEAAVEAATPVETARSVHAPVSAAVETVRSVVMAAPRADEIVAPAARLMETGAERARETYAHAKTAGDHFRQAVGETAAVTTRGALEVNGKVIDALRAQSDAAFDLWRQALTAGSLSEAIRLHTSGTRQVYETAASHWKDVAETTTRWLGATMKPLQAAIERSRRD